MNESNPAAPSADPHDDVVYPDAIPFLIVHLACFAAFWTGVTPLALGIGIGLYWLRIFAIGAGYHRYFSHRAFETSRAFQFVLAFVAQSTTQKSVLWWASKHRDHHLHSDTELDVHSPRQFGFLYSHMLWIFARRHGETNLVKVQDFAQYPELMWLHRFEVVPPVVLAILCFAAAGWSGLVVGFFWSTVAVYHGTFCINSLAHVHGKRRYITGDDSRNNWLLAVLTMGEGWHNNHHAYQSSVRQGFRWWEFDPTFYLLWLMERVGLVWNLKHPPQEIVENRRRIGSRALTRAAEQVAATFNAETLALAAARAATHAGIERLQARLREAKLRTAEIWAEADIPGLPSRAEILRRARAMLAHSPSLEDVAAAAYAMVLSEVSLRLQAIPAPAT